MVYRADNIHPMDLELQNGFLPRGLGGSAHNRLSLDFSLYNHVLGTSTGSSTSNSAFVATAKSEQAARRILSLSLNDVGFIYKIHVTSNFYDVEGTLGGYYMHTSEEEVAALGKINFSQVVGWIEFRQGVEQPFVKNHKYDHRVFDTEVWAGVEYRIAGFPESHAAWKQEPWKSAKEGKPWQRPCSPGRKRHISCGPIQPEAEGKVIMDDEASTIEGEVDAEAEKLFHEFASKFGLITRASISWRMSLPEVRERFQMSGRQSSIYRMKRWSQGVVAATAVTGQILFDITSVGTRRMSDLDRAAILMSVLPGVGCSFQAMADEAHGMKDATDAFLCVAADVLMLQGLGLPLIALDILRVIRRRYVETKMPSPAEMRQLRDKGWDTYQQEMIGFIRSPDFIMMMSNHFMAEMAGVMFEAAEALGRLRVIKRQALAKPLSVEEENSILKDFFQDESSLRSNLSSQAWQRHHRLKLDLPLIIKESLEKQAEEFNQIFISNFEYDVKNNKYEPWAPWGITTIKLEREAQAIVQHLRNSHPATPDLGEIQDRVHKALAYLETPSLCTEYRPDGGIAFRCGDPSDGDNYRRGGSRCDDKPCTVYRPPEYQTGCELGYKYDDRDKKCRLSTLYQELASNSSQEAQPPPCTERRDDGGINFNCGGPSDGDTY